MRWRLVAAGLVLGALTGCTSTVTGAAAPSTVDPSVREKITTYFADLDAAGKQGTAAQQRFFQRTQHPQYRGHSCDLGDLTLDETPAYATLRSDPNWRPQRGSAPPSGAVYVVAVALTIKHDGSTVGNQVGSERVVLLDGSVYGFAPCPQG